MIIGVRLLTAHVCWCTFFFLLLSPLAMIVIFFFRPNYVNCGVVAHRAIGCLYSFLWFLEVVYARCRDPLDDTILLLLLSTNSSSVSSTLSHPHLPLLLITGIFFSAYPFICY
uniref:Uncharacterized protein n=1 Tax=Trypanosoma congolense (strain IL3000) TaxID=1068625 RepID=G0V0F6_TRYCI|nr:hypothetical protein, unlikely [Trypanosoma congolense IL3000]